MALAMVALTLFVIAMIASYSGAFAKPTLHHMAVAVAGPEQLVDAIRGQDALAVTEVGDAAAARQQVYERKTDAAFVVAPNGEMTIYVAGGGGRSVANAAETVGRGIAANIGHTASVQDVAPASAGDPSGTVEFYAVIFISIGFAGGGGHVHRIGGRHAVRTHEGHRAQARHPGVAHHLAGRILGTPRRGRHPLRRHHSRGVDRPRLAGVRRALAVCDGGRRGGHRSRRGVRHDRVDGAHPVPRRHRQRRGRRSRRPAPAVRLLLHVHRDRAARIGHRIASQCPVLRRPRRAGTHSHAGDLGCRRVCAGGGGHGRTQRAAEVRSSRVAVRAAELSCQS